MFIHTHASGRFTATPAEEEAALDDYMSHSAMVTVTEVDANLRARCLKEPGFLAVFGDKGPRDDCGIALRLSVFKVLDSGTETLSELRYKTEQGKLSDTTEGAYAVVREKATNKIGVTVVVHMPHGMQDQLRTGRITSDVAKAYRDILRGARRLANRLARKFKAHWTMIVGDWNLNIKKPWVQTYLRAAFPNFKVNWRPPFPMRGSFMLSIIDLALLRGANVTRPTLLPHRVGFDHVAWRQNLTSEA